jgi:hypothetical protein
MGGKMEGQVGLLANRHLEFVGARFPISKILATVEGNMGGRTVEKLVGQQWCEYWMKMMTSSGKRHL